MAVEAQVPTPTQRAAGLEEGEVIIMVAVVATNPSTKKPVTMQGLRGLLVVVVVVVLLVVVVGWAGWMVRGTMQVEEASG